MLRSLIKYIDDFPKPGIKFRDLSRMFESPVALSEIVQRVCSKLPKVQGTGLPAVDCIVGIEARGFALGAVLAYYLDVPFIMCRKAGKLPGKIRSMEYSLEYGTAVIEIQDSAPIKGDVLIVDDILATGGTTEAVAKLVSTFSNVKSITTFNILHLKDLGGLDYLKKNLPTCNHITLIDD